MSNPFININVQPAYRNNTAVVSWTVASRLRDADFYIYKSFNKGTAPWVLLNDLPVKGTYFEDSQLNVNVPYYRILLKKGSLEYDSPVIGAFDKLSRAQYGGVHKMMSLEFKRMSSGNGLQVLHYSPLINGEYAEDTDPLTEQQYGVHCKAGESTDSDYGQLFKGGFASPIYTWMEILEYGPQKNAEDSSKLAMVSEITHTGRMLAYPMPSPGDLVIHPPTDNRYAVISPVKGDYFRGIIPISFNVGLQLLSHADSRYGVPVPPNLPKPLWAKI